MSHYLWPLGSNYNNEYMDTDDFLANCREVTKKSGYHNVKWRVQPGFVPFNYVTNYYPINGCTQEITASGIFSEEGIALNDFFSGYIFPDEYLGVHGPARKLTFGGEGVRLTKLYYRINDGKWMELSPGLKWIEFDLSKNGDKVEIKATYQVWTMGNPHSAIPFMWLGDVDGSYNDGKNRFTDAVPVNPGRKHSGIINYHKGKDYNADWQLKNVSWFAPGSTMLESNWSYQCSIYLRNEIYKKANVYLNTWSDRYNCQVFNDQYMDKPPGYYDYHWYYGWQYHYPNYNTNDKTSGWWKSPYKTRKSLWWIYEKTYTDVYTASGISKTSSTTPVKNPTLQVVQDDLNTVYNPNSKWLNGTAGKLFINFSGPTLAFVDIYAKQLMFGEEITTKIISGEAITSGVRNTIDIVFNNYPQLYRSKNIAYYMEIFTVQNGVPVYQYKPNDTSYTSLLSNGTHYYNDEPPWVANIKIHKIASINALPNPLPTSYSCMSRYYLEQYIKQQELYEITWDTPTDPDNHPVHYSFLQDEGNLQDIIFSTAEDYTLNYGRNNDWTLRYRRGTGDTENENTTLLDAEKATIVMSSTNSALYNIPTKRLIKDTSGKYIDPLNIWIVPHDGRTNNYYYGTRVNLLHTGYEPIQLEVVYGTPNDIGTIKLTHNDYINATVDVKIYAFMSNNQFDQNSGSYLGIIYEGPIEPGYTTKTFSVYDKISNSHKIKRGHYIKYAIECEALNQSFNPYAKDAWSLAKGYHIYNCLPTATTPFVCEELTTLFSDKTASIAWNESLDADKESVTYKIYVASINKPTMNTKSDTFWIKDDKDNNKEIRSYYKMINAGTTLPTKYMPYKLNISEFSEGDSLNIWITATDNKGSLRYLTGDTLTIDHLSVKLYPPSIRVSNATAYNLLGKNATDGESGYVQVCHTNTSGMDATVRLYAICKKIDGPNAGDMKLFNNVASWNLKSGEWSTNTKIHFKVAFGEEWSNSEVKYFAVSTTTSGQTSFDSKDMTTNAYDKWYGTHIYNEHPTPSVIRYDDPKTDLHKNIYIDWSYLIFEDFKDLKDVTIIDGIYDKSTPKIYH